MYAEEKLKRKLCFYSENFSFWKPEHCYKDIGMLLSVRKINSTFVKKFNESEFKSHSETNTVKMFISSHINTRKSMKRLVSEKKEKDMEKIHCSLYLFFLMLCLF